jgi:hypothetical protein
MINKSIKFYLILWICFLSSILFEVEAQKSNRKTNKPKRKRSQNPGESDPWKGVSFTVWIFILCLAPPLYIFLKNIWTDPMMPSVFANGIDLIKDKMMGFLGKSNKDEAQENARKMQ